MKVIIQTRADLDSLKGTQHYTDFIDLLKGSMTKRVCVTEYPEGYNYDLKEGEEGYLPLEFADVEDLSVIESFGFTKEDILKM